MVKICCVDGCNDTKDDVTYFKFPNSRTLRRRWLDAFTPSEKVTIDSVVCSRHFLEGQYELVRGKKRLKAKVVPSVFIEDQPKSPKTVANDAEQNEDIPAKTNEIATDTRKTKSHTADTQTPASTIDSELCNGIVRRTDPSITAIDSEANNDIEDIITNYHIKQIRPLNVQREINDTDSGELANVIVNEQTNSEMATLVQDLEFGNEEMKIIDVDNLQDPVFIEVGVDKAGDQDQTNQDCLMLLESVQCEVDPSSLMFQDNDIETDADTSSDVVDLGEKKEDPISLLTSSDEDEVIIEEPHIDTVEVSDETDEDDMPLVKLVDKRPKKSKKTKSKSSKSKTKSKSVHSAENNIAKIMWGLYEYYCVECHFRTTSKSEFKKHATEHPTVIQICQMCGYTTASKAQFARHKRKHQDEKKFKCHLCDYKARHNMSLIYHLKSHDSVRLVNAKRGFRCEKCGFQSDVKTSLLKHIRLCTTDTKKYVCGKCSYETKRKSDLRRHKLRRHKEANEEGDDDYVPPNWS
ncbi:zinc-responsive transcriptional regulator ZAP1-like isoform X1 [Vanessa atalanta]|uniref:zinc-responsive transcriptional regulator ZAP1-like isoform X1 n=1 Tax=Vanessa atalanta TaxID=42275 RepID=UPI001FCDC458|nr:zinc-responsive transcriptional regulator ZAP1-like isoform X1 [Vanessa atalanta]